MNTIQNIIRTIGTNFGALMLKTLRSTSCLRRSIRYDAIPYIRRYSRFISRKCLTFKKNKASTEQDEERKLNSIVRTGFKYRQYLHSVVFGRKYKPIAAPTASLGNEIKEKTEDLTSPMPVSNNTQCHQDSTLSKVKSISFPTSLKLKKERRRLDNRSKAVDLNCHEYMQLNSPCLNPSCNPKTCPLVLKSNYVYASKKSFNCEKLKTPITKKIIIKPRVTFFMKFPFHCDNSCAQVGMKSRPDFKDVHKDIQNYHTVVWLHTTIQSILLAHKQELCKRSNVDNTKGPQKNSKKNTSITNKSKKNENHNSFIVDANDNVHFLIRHKKFVDLMKCEQAICTGAVPMSASAGLNREVVRIATPANRRHDVEPAFNSLSGKQMVFQQLGLHGNNPKGSKINKMVRGSKNLLRLIHKWLRY